MSGASTNEPKGGSTANTERAIMGILVGLALKAALDTAYAQRITSPSVSTFQSLLGIICDVPTVQVFVFVTTLLRFIYGAHRIIETVERSASKLEWWAGVWNILGMLLLFILFYMTGLCVQHPVPFYAGLIAVHLWDWIWFARFVSSSDELERTLKRVMRRFMWIDVATVIGLLIVIWPLEKYAVWAGLILMTLLAIADSILNFRFFFPDESAMRPVRSPS